ncbi:dienelactone hydrolase family protein [Ramlibacter sp. AN1133]|uniref:dienelactone hydrolase family protein n=1 Tax=Ramlibacter sp. AN1133 TaxID=3133429 RepID=UPI0030C4B8F0
MLHEQVQVGPGGLPGELVAPEGATGLVLFAHGSGSSRLSPRNIFVARALQARGLATLLFDLLTPHEARNRVNVFEIALLGERLEQAIAWVRGRPGVGGLPLGLFGASTGAAGALLAAAERPRDVAAVVSRGGRPDLALAALPRVRAPTLLVVGGGDTEVLGFNRVAFAHLACEKRLEVVPGATHLFEEPGTLEEVAALAGDWFLSHLRRGE